jgi:Putative restriction endonuclease
MSVSIPRAKPSSPAEQPERRDASLPLKDGDRLTRDEFERRYDAMPNLSKAELIDGVVHVPSPVRQRHHSAPHFNLIGCLFNYRARTPGIEGGNNPSVRLDLGNMPQPDCLLFISNEYGGQAKVDDDDYVSGGPDLVAEVAASTAHYDVNHKLEVYQRHGVREYVVWRVADREIDWFVLRDGHYEKLSPAEDGILRSTVFPGLWLDQNALLSDDCDTLLNVLQRGLDSPEHAAFKARLQRAKVEPAGLHAPETTEARNPSPSDRL